MKYIKPQIEIAEVDFVLLTASGPGATDIFAPNVDNNSKSVWDEEETQYNIKEEQDYEDWN